MGQPPPPRIEVPTPPGEIGVDSEESIGLPLMFASTGVKRLDRAANIVCVANERHPRNAPQRTVVDTASVIEDEQPPTTHIRLQGRRRRVAGQHQMCRRYEPGYRIVDDPQ